MSEAPSSPILARLDALDDALAAKGFPRLSPWWRDTLWRFYQSGRRTLVLRVGRRGGKSSTLARLAVCEGLYGDHSVPPGDVGVVAMISVSRDEANQRLRTIKAILDALGVTYHPIEAGIELDQRPIAFKVFSATVAGVSGFTCIAAICDEVSKWKDSETGSNPAREVVSSLRPTMATQPHAKLFISSSPLGTSDFHYETFERGDTADQVAAYAPSWAANPTLTEQGTHELEPDERVWAREYLASPQAGGLGAFDLEAVKRAVRTAPDGMRRGQRALVIDPSSGRSDAWTWAVVSWLVPAGGEFLTHQRYLNIVDGDPVYVTELVRNDAGDLVRNPDYDKQARPVLQVEEIGGVEGNFWRQVSGGQIVDRLAVLCRRWGIKLVHGDQRESLMLESEFRRAGLRYIAHVWSNASKVEAVARVRRWFREGQIVIPQHDKLIREIGSFQEQITASGAITFGARGSTHDDYVALLLTAAMADAAGQLSYSPAIPRRAYHLPPNLLA